MALTHANPGDLIHLGPLDSTSPPTAGGTRALFKTSRVEVIRLELPQGKTIKEHRAPGELIVQCLQGRVTFTTMNREITIEPGQLFYLSESEPHAVHAHDDSRLLLTVLSPGKVQGRAENE
jgi:quercetin dioxygenase-like cupin family protein